jgi:hypothetical protein
VDVGVGREPGLILLVGVEVIEDGMDFLVGIEGNDVVRESEELDASPALAFCGSALNEIRRRDKRVQGLLNRIVDTESSSVIAACETRLAKLEREKPVLTKKLESGGPAQAFEEMLELACRLLGSPWILWQSGGWRSNEPSSGWRFRSE